jgi:hypothetical protein
MTTKKLLCFAPSLVLVSAVAHAQPSVTETARPTAASATDELGIAISGGELMALELLDQSLPTADAVVTVDYGQRIDASPAWWHVEAGAGHAAIFSSDEGALMTAYQARGGLALRGCIARAVCTYGGVDLGYEHVDAMHGSGSGDEMIAVPRVGVELGNRVRFRPGLETEYGLAGTGGGLGPRLTLGVAWSM